MYFLKWILSFFKKEETKKDKIELRILPKQKEESFISEKGHVQITDSISEIPEEEKKISIHELIKNERERLKNRKEFYLDGNEIILPVLGLKFIFCKKSWKKFNEEFKSPLWEIDYDANEGYILRKSGSAKEYFHIWLMNDKIEDFLDKRRCTKDNVQVHHRNHNRRDNSLNNLAVLSKVEHHEHHIKEKAYEKWIGNRRSFEDWWFKNHKEEKDPTLRSTNNRKLV